MLRDLLAEVKEARAAALDVLTEAEATKPKHIGSTRFSWTIEDPLQDIVAHEKDPRRDAARAALGRFQRAINAALEHEIAERWHEKFAALWLTPKGTGKPRASSSYVDMDAAVAEAEWILRGLLAYVADPTEIKQWDDYCFVVTKRELDEWAESVAAPVEIPRALRRIAGASADMVVDGEVGEICADESDGSAPTDRAGFDRSLLEGRTGNSDPAYIVLEELTIEQRRRIFG